MKKGHDVHSIGGGVLLVCLSESIARGDEEPFAMGIIAWDKGQSPPRESTVGVRLRALEVGDCAPFSFRPRWLMLSTIHQANPPDLTFRDGQAPIFHLEADLHTVVDWATQNNRRWAFTLSNAGSRFFEDRCDLAHL